MCKAGIGTGPYTCPNKCAPGRNEPWPTGYVCNICGYEFCGLEGLEHDDSPIYNQPMEFHINVSEELYICGDLQGIQYQIEVDKKTPVYRMGECTPAAFIKSKTDTPRTLREKLDALQSPHQTKWKKCCCGAEKVYGKDTSLHANWCDMYVICTQYK